jgi:hypothetical protein
VRYNQHPTFYVGGLSAAQFRPTQTRRQPKAHHETMRLRNPQDRFDFIVGEAVRWPFLNPRKESPWHG